MCKQAKTIFHSSEVNKDRIFGPSFLRNRNKDEITKYLDQDRVVTDKPFVNSRVLTSPAMSGMDWFAARPQTQLV